MFIADESLAQGEIADEAAFAIPVPGRDPDLSIPVEIARPGTHPPVRDMDFLVQLGPEWSLTLPGSSRYVGLREEWLGRLVAPDPGSWSDVGAAIVAWYRENSARANVALRLGDTQPQKWSPLRVGRELTSFDPQPGLFDVTARTRSTPAVIDQDVISGYDVVERQAVRDFLDSHEVVSRVLVSAPDQIKRFFGAGATLALEVMRDPEGGHQELFVVIGSRLARPDARAALDGFEEHWWFHQPEFPLGVLSFAFE
jgi:hypothetical protein